MIRVGDTRYEQPVCFGDGAVYKGTVIFVHPSQRWYTVEFDIVPVIRRRICYGGKVSQMVESDGRPVKLREAFFAPVEREPMKKGFPSKYS